MAAFIYGKRPVVPSTSTITATYAYYIVAYSHPIISPHERIQRLQVDTESDGKAIVNEPRDIYGWKAATQPTLESDGMDDEETHPPKSKTFVNDLTLTLTLHYRPLASLTDS